MYIDKYFGISKRIAKWKESSQFESELADSAEYDLKSRYLYAKYYRDLNPTYYEKGLEFARQLYDSHLNDFVDTDFHSVYEDMIYCLHRYGFSFQDYCIYRLIDKSERCRQQFVSDKLRYHYCDILNNPDVERMMTDKLECYNHYSKFFKREMIPCLSQDDYSGFASFINKNKKFIYKPIADHSGHGIKIMDSKDIIPEQWFLHTIKNNPGIIEELITQGKDLNIMNPGSINSCRIVAFTIGDQVSIIGGALRMGVGSAITDNAGSGGIYASIDVKNGILQSDAKNYLNHHYKFHPTTGTQILGFKLPEWENAINLIKEMSAHIEGTTLISWDIAYSTKGWCMVEANDNGDWSIIQSNLECGMKRELYSLMDKYFEYKKNDSESF